MTFAINHSPVQVQLCSTHSIHDLVDILCRETTIGDTESVHDHMWNIVSDKGIFESGDFECQSEL